MCQYIREYEDEQYYGQGEDIEQVVWDQVLDNELIKGVVCYGIYCQFDEENLEERNQCMGSKFYVFFC